jgi:hypothetical protein
MPKQWAASAVACVLIATFSANLFAQTPTTASSPAPADNLAAWGPYARLAGQTRLDVNPEGKNWMRWRWETPGEALIQEWHRGPENLAKPGKGTSTATLRLGSKPGTFVLKGDFLMGKEWDGTLQDDGSVSFVGRGMLKMLFSIRVDEQGNYEELYRGFSMRYVANPNSATPEAVAQTPPPATPTAPQAQAPAQTTSPAPAPVAASLAPAPAVEKPAPVAAEKSAPVVAKLPAPPAKPIKAPRQLTEEDTQRIWQSVQQSRAQSLAQARQNELARQEAARQAAIQEQIWAAERAQREAEEAAAEAEMEVERQQKAAAWNAMARANEQALNDSLQSLRDTTARIQAQQAQAQTYQAPVDPIGAAERQRQVQLINEANRRQDEIAAGYAAQRAQNEQARAAAPPPTYSASNSKPPSFDAGRASTDTDANRCVTSPEVRVNDTFQGNTAAYVTNGCGTPVDVRVCLMADKGWNCGVKWGLASQSSWSHSSFHATGPVFVDAKVAGSSGKLASPN